MKTRIWIILVGSLLAVSLALSLPLFLNGETAAVAQVWSGGELVRTVSLALSQEFTVTSPDGGTNTVTVRDGSIAVTDASCPDHYCMHRGFCSGGSSIVCLPNRLIIEFKGDQDVDFVVE